VEGSPPSMEVMNGLEEDFLSWKKRQRKKRLSRIVTATETAAEPADGGVEATINNSAEESIELFLLDRPKRKCCHRKRGAASAEKLVPSVAMATRDNVPLAEAEEIEIRPSLQFEHRGNTAEPWEQMMALEWTLVTGQQTTLLVSPLEDITEASPPLSSKQPETPLLSKCTKQQLKKRDPHSPNSPHKQRAPHRLRMLHGQRSPQWQWQGSAKILIKVWRKSQQSEVDAGGGGRPQRGGNTHGRCSHGRL